jgi:hypothetical protein
MLTVVPYWSSVCHMSTLETPWNFKDCVVNHYNAEYFHNSFIFKWLNKKFCSYAIQNKLYVTEPDRSHDGYPNDTSFQEFSNYWNEIRILHLHKWGMGPVVSWWILRKSQLKTSSVPHMLPEHISLIKLFFRNNKNVTTAQHRLHMLS